MENIKVLVIDDDLMTCSLLETILQLENYQTVSVNSIENILSLLDQEKPHILILDFHLGSKETLELVPIIRADADWRHLRILMTSAIDLRQDCLEAGANGFILKPFNWQEMMKIISKIRNDLLR